MPHLSPAQAIALWSLLREGIGTPLTDQEEYIDRLRHRNTQWLTVFAVVAGLGVLIAASALLIGKPPSPQTTPKRPGRAADG